MGVGEVVVVGDVHGVTIGAQTSPVDDGGVQLHPATAAQLSAVRTHLDSVGTHQKVQPPLQPGGGGSGGGGGV